MEFNLIASIKVFPLKFYQRLLPEICIHTLIHYSTLLRFFRNFNICTVLLSELL